MFTEAVGVTLLRGDVVCLGPMKGQKYELAWRRAPKLHPRRELRNRRARGLTQEFLQAYNRIPYIRG